MSFPTFDQSLPWTKKTNRTLENELSNILSVVALNQENESNSWKWAFQRSISRCPEPRKRIELLKMIFPTLDQSLPWTKKTNRTLENELSNARWFRATTDRALESSFSRVRFVFLVQGNDWSSVGKLIFKSSIRFLGSGQRLMECWKAHFQEFDSFSWFRATTDRMLESSFSRVRFVFLVQGNDWSNVGKLIFKSSIRFLGSGQQLIERWKAHFQEFDSFSWFRATTDRALESSFSRVRFVFLVQGKDWSNVGKLVFKSSIRFLGSGQRLIECWKAHFQEFDSFSWFRATTDRMLESSFSRVRFVFLVQGKDWSNVGKLVFKSSIRFLQSLPWTKKTNRTLENELSNIRSVVALNQENESNSWKRAFQHSISPCPEPRKRIELLKTSFPTFDQSLPWTKKTNRTLENELSNIWSVVTLDGSGQRLIECWKARFQEFDSFTWFRATTDRMLESSFSRVRFVFLVQGNDWSSVGKLIFKSSIRFLQSLPWTKKTNRTLENELSNIRSVVALNQENESNSWKWAFQRSISRCPEPRKRIELLKTSFSTLDHSLPWSRCPEPRKRIELLKMSFPTLDQSLPWTKKTNRTLENELSNARWFRATTDRMLESSFSRVRFVFLVQGNDWSNVGKIVFKSSIRFLGSGQGLIECWKAHFQEFDSFPWFRATTDRALESSFSRVRFVFLVQGNDWSSVGKLIFKSSIRFLGSGQRLIECWKARFQEFDSFTWFRARTDRVLESSFSRVRFVYLVQGNDWSSVGKLIFKSSIRLLGSGQRLIECWKARFQEFDSFSWFRATTDRMLESSFSRVRFIYLVQGNDWSNVGKLIFKSSIRFLGSGQRLIECWKARFQEFDSFSWFRATTDRALESSFSRVRFVFLVQGKDWSSVGKLIFKSSIRFLGSGQRFQGNDWSSVGKLIFKSSIRFFGSGQRLIERWKAHFQEFDSFSWFRATTDRMLESSFSRVRFVFLVQGKDWSNVGKLVFKSSIRLLGSGQRLIECWKAHFQEFDSFPWFRATTDRMLESSFSRVRFVFLVQGNDWSNVGKLIFKSSIRFLGSEQRLIECWKARFQEFDSFLQSLPWTKKTNRTLENELSNIRSVVALNQETNRTLENELSNIRSVVALNQENESNSWKWAFQHSISRCPEPSKRIELLKTIFPTFDGSGQRLIECWKARFQEFDSFSWFRATTDRMLESSFSRVRFVFLVRATTDRMLESSFSRVRFVFLVQGNDWSNVGKLIFKSSIRFLGSGQRLIERWKAHFQEFDSFSWFRATTDRALESSFSRVRFVFLVQGNDWSSVGKLIFKSSIRFLGSGQRLIERWKAHFQEFDSFSWFRATTDRMLESSFSRVRFVFLVQGKDWSSVGKLIFKSSIRFLGSGQRLIERWKAHFQEFDSFSWFRATTDRMLESSFSRVRFVYLVQGNDWSNVGKLVFKSLIRFLGSEQRLIECWKARFQEFDSFSWFRATTDRALESSFSRVRFVFLVQGNDWSNVGKLVFKSSIRFLGSGQRLIECWKAHFQEFDSFSSVVALNQENESNSWKRAFQHSISRCPEPRKRIELLKMSFPTFDQSLPWTNKTNRTLENELSNARSVVALKSLPWTKKTNRTLENELSNIRSVVALNQENESNSWKRAFQHSISRCPEPRKRIELLKTSFPTFDQSLLWTKKTNRTLENELSNIRSVVALNQVNESNSWKRSFQHSMVQGNDWSNVGKLVFKSSIHFLGSEQRLIECWKARFQEFDSFSWFRATTDRMLESSFSRVRFVFLVQGNDWSNVGKLIFKSSIRFLGSGQRLIERWKAHFQEFDSFSWFRATTDRALESSFSRVRFVFLVQGNDWSSVGKLIFKSSIRFLGSGQRLIERWKAHFQEFDSFSWFRATTDRMLESSFSRVRFVFLVQGKDWSSVGKLIFKSSICFLGSGQRLIERWKAHFQEFDSFSWFRATTDRMLESSFSRVRFVYLVQGNDWSNVGKLVFKSLIRFLGSEQRLIECWKARFQEFDSFSWFRATTDRALESSFSRVRFVFLVQGNDWSNVGKLVFKSSIRFLGSGQRLIECWKAHFQEFDSFSSVVALNQENESNSWKRAFQHSISRCPEPRKRIELLKMSFPTFDQSLPWTNKTNRTLENELSNARSVVALKSLPWTKKTNRTLENELCNARSVVALNQENESNSWKWAFQRSISRCPEPRKRIELLKMSFPTFDQSLPWTKKTNRTLENELSNARSVLALNQENESNSWKRAFQHSISRCPEPRKRIELLKMSFPTFDQSLPWTK